MRQNGVFYWYPVHTRSRHEDKADLRLQAKSINTFLPKIEVWSKRVRVVNGPLMGCEGIILDLKKKDRLIISIDLLQRSVSVELDGADLEPVIS